MVSVLQQGCATMSARVKIFPTAGYWFLAMFAVTIVAFWPVYFAVLPFGPEPLAHLHMVGIAAWVALLVTQPFLINRGKFEIHRRVGRLS